MSVILPAEPIIERSPDWPGLGFVSFIPVILVLVVVDLALRGIALWRSARRGENIWFILLLVINTAGILPLIYLLTHRASKK